MKVLLTGGAGYIGSHTAVTLLERGHEVIVVDNFVNSSPESIKRVERITGKTVQLHSFDIRDKKQLGELFASTPIDAVIHFAGLKAVGESVEKPLLYYENNLDSTFSLIETMQSYGVKKLIFSSSATVYGTPENLPLTENSSVGIGITNPYGWSKFMIERILEGVCAANPELEVTILRYFNPIGAHESGQIGEDPNGLPNNLLPYISQVAIGKRDHLTINGDDYDTPDGTCVRDYIHVVDLARGHADALAHGKPGAAIYNLGTGTGTSVYEALHAFEKACGHTIPYTVGPRRSGDIASCYADSSKAATELGWKAEKTLEEACVDAWRWQSQNPNGYDS